MIKPIAMSSPDKAVLHPIASKHLDKVWPQAAPMIETALIYADGKYNLDSIYKAISERDKQLWVATYDNDLIAVCVTEITIYPCKKVLTVFASAGIRMDAWLDFLQPIMAWGKSQGCEAAEIYGRKGWERILAKYGYEHVSTVIRAKL